MHNENPTDYFVARPILPSKWARQWLEKEWTGHLLLVEADR